MRVLIADDSALVRNILREVFKEDGKITIAGEARNGEEAITKNGELAPDLIIMDINMPKLSGLEATRTIMEQNPVPIVIFSNVIDSTNSYQALNYGAVEVMRKPDIDKLNNPQFSRNFLEKLHTISRVKVRRYREVICSRTKAEYGGTEYKIVVMGASTGGPAAIRTILRKLPPGLPVAFVLVQHLESGFDQSFAQWLDDNAGIPVELAKDNEIPEPGKMVVAPAGRHLVFRDGKLRLENSGPINNQRPSVDNLFKSAAANFRKNTIAVLLTGMGQDGAEGCLAVQAQGGVTIVQDQATSTIFGMPKAAIDRNAASKILPLQNIPEEILRLLKKR